jgi:glutamine amidotransferase
MGWNQVKMAHHTALLAGIPDGAYYYFVHSYVVPNGRWVKGTFSHGEEFPAVIQHDNFVGVQFHPERSSTWGHRLLENFLRL